MSVFGCGQKTDTDIFTSTYDGYLTACAQCHTPKSSTYQDINLDMSNVQIAKQSLLSKSNIPGKPDCSGLPFIVPGESKNSMFIAVLDPSVRTFFEIATGCVPSDLENVMSMLPPENSILNDLKTWIDQGAK